MNLYEVLKYLQINPKAHLHNEVSSSPHHHGDDLPDTSRNFPYQQVLTKAAVKNVLQDTVKTRATAGVALWSRVRKPLPLSSNSG